MLLYPRRPHISNRVTMLTGFWYRLRLAVLLLSMLSTPLRGVAQSNEQEKRGLGLPTPTPTAGNKTLPSLGSKPELVLQAGHTKAVNAIAFGPDGSWLAS